MSSSQSIRGGYPVRPSIPRIYNVSAAAYSTDMNLTSATAKTFYFAPSPDGSTVASQAMSDAAKAILAQTAGRVVRVATLTKLSANTNNIKVAWNQESPYALIAYNDGLVDPGAIAICPGPCWCMTLLASADLTWGTDFLISGAT